MHVCQVGRACVSSLEPIGSVTHTRVRADSPPGPVGPDSDSAVSQLTAFSLQSVRALSPVSLVSLDHASNANIRAWSTMCQPASGATSEKRFD